MLVCIWIQILNIFFLCENAAIFLTGACVDIIGPYGFQIVKAMSTNCVTPYELGKINALLSAIDSLMPAGISQIYASLWKVLIL